AELSGNADDILSIAVVDLAGRKVEVRGLDRLRYLKDRETVGAEFLGVDVDLNLALITADERDLSDSSDLRQTWLDAILHKLVEFLVGECAGSTHAKDREF